MEGKDRVRLVEGDVLDTVALDAAMAGQEVVYANLSGDMEKAGARHRITDPLHAYQVSKRGNALRVMAESAGATAGRESTRSAPALSPRRSPRMN